MGWGGGLLRAREMWQDADGKGQGRLQERGPGLGGAATSLIEINGLLRRVAANLPNVLTA